jgi:hypothetical protein
MLPVLIIINTHEHCMCRSVRLCGARGWLTLVESGLVNRSHVIRVAGDLLIRAQPKHCLELLAMNLSTAKAPLLDP